MSFLKIILALMIMPVTAEASHFGLFFQSSKSWPIGADGALALNGIRTYTLKQSVTYPGKLQITDGSTQPFDNIGSFVNVAGVNNVCVLDFKSLSISSLVNLAIDPSCSWAVIGVSGTFVLAGSIIGNNNYVGATTTFNMKEPSSTGALTGPTLSYTTVQSAGGVGGSGGNAQYLKCATGIGYGGVAVASVAGNASGGATGGFSYASGLCSFGSYGSFPGSGGTAVTSTAAGFGANNNGSTTAATNPGESGAGSSTATNGSNGGFRGAHGQGIYLKLKGQSAGTGTINVSGLTGGSGGPTINYTNPSFYTAQGGAGGGGGGAGGSAGSIIIKYSKTTTAPGFNLVKTAGAGGTGAAGGAGAYSTANGYSGVAATGGTGGNGTTGAVGSSSVISY